MRDLLTIVIVSCLSMPLTSWSLVETKNLEPPQVTKFADNVFGEPDMVMGTKILDWPKSTLWGCQVKFYKERHVSGFSNPVYEKVGYMFRVPNIQKGQTILCDVDNRRVTIKVMDEETVVRTHIWRFDDKGRWVR